MILLINFMIGIGVNFHSSYKFYLEFNDW